jgi:putative multicomponent Na+:H+ antiporter subunit B
MMGEKIILILMVIFAILAVREDKLRRAVIYLGTFSLVGSFIYLLYGAPDVAIAEAIIGSTLATILYLVALKKYKIFTVYYTTKIDDEITEIVEDNIDEDNIDEDYIDEVRSNFVDMIDRFCESRELEPHVVYTTESREAIELKHQYDAIAVHGKDGVLVYGSKENYQMDLLRESMNNYMEQMGYKEKFVIIKN